jgi:hypothetical protein
MDIALILDWTSGLDAQLRPGIESFGIENIVGAVRGRID